MSPLSTTRHALVLGLCLWSASLYSGPLAQAQPSVLERAPNEPDPQARYLFYLHGRIIEGHGRRPKHPQYGVYEYDQVLQALGRSGAVVISEERRAGTRVEAYAKRVAQQIQALRAAGVPDAQIAVVGFSKGGWIAQRVSALVTAPIRYVLLAACPPGDDQKTPTLHGHVLSVRERSDSVPSCKRLFARAAPGTRTKEIMVELGGAHGAFYRPNPAWLQPVLKSVTPKTP